MAKVPPHNTDAEESVLGAILIDRDSITLIADILKPNHFYNQKLGDIYDAMISLYEERQPIDLLTLATALKKKKKLKQIGGSAFLAGLAERVPTASHVEYYARIIKDDYTKRELVTLSAELNELAFDEGKSVQEILDTAESQVFGLSQQNLKKNFVHVKDVLAENFDRLDELHRSDGGMRGVPTGFKDLDTTLSGMQPSNLLILAARPGMGKTAFSLNICHNVAVNEGMPIGFFSLEMSKEELIDRLLVMQSGIDAWKLKTGRLADDEFARYSDAMGVLADSPIYIDDTPGMTVLEMRTKARRLVSEQGLKLIVVDYIGLARPGRQYESRVQEVGEVSMGLKNLARELKIPVIALSQLNRAVENRGNMQPQLSDLRESGSIEQDADVVMFLYREDSEDLENVRLAIAKHRNGPIRTIDLRFLGGKMKFYSVDTQHAGGEG